MEILPTDERAPAPDHRRRPRWVWLAVAAAIVVIAIVALVAVGHNGSSTDSSSSFDAEGNPLTLPGLISVGQSLPNATLQRVNGGSVSLHDFRGKPLVVNLWFTNCPPCKTEMPALEQLHKEFGNRVAFLGVDPPDGASTALHTGRQFGITYDLALDPRYLVVKAIGSEVTPTTVVLTPTGLVSWVHVGAVKANDLRSAIDQALR
jgi:thiol-disulfide isomerase/thioredoxin